MHNKRVTDLSYHYEYNSFNTLIVNSHIIVTVTGHTEQQLCNTAIMGPHMYQMCINDTYLLSHLVKQGTVGVFHSVKIILLATSVPSTSVCCIAYGSAREAFGQPNRAEHQEQY